MGDYNNHQSVMFHIRILISLSREVMAISVDPDGRKAD